MYSVHLVIILSSCSLHKVDVYMDLALYYTRCGQGAKWVVKTTLSRHGNLVE